MTLLQPVVFIPRVISIHTPTRGVTHKANQFACNICHFNPHSYKGSDFSHLMQSLSFQAISIHTLTRGVTKSGDCIVIQLLNFNPHSRKGSDIFIFWFSAFRFWFQSTLPQREWQKTLLLLMPCGTFQSTLPQREWQIGPFMINYISDFNPHSRKGSDTPLF